MNGFWIVGVIDSNKNIYSKKISFEDTLVAHSELFQMYEKAWRYDTIERYIQASMLNYKTNMINDEDLINIKNHLLNNYGIDLYKE